jgi:hypothetical protein
MSASRPSLSPELDALLAHEREIAPVRETTRARSLARARAALGAGDARPAHRPVEAPPFRWAAVAAIVCVAGAAGAVAYGGGAHFWARPAPAPVPAVATPGAAPSLAPPRDDDAPAAPPEAAPTTRAPLRPTVGPPAADDARVELALMGQARAAVARGDYARALTPLAEHARRFKEGRLVEEREALRVKSLAGLGRHEEAQRAASAFRVRFPRSVLLPAVRQMSASAQTPQVGP